MNIGIKIKKIRELNNLTQEEFAEKLKMSLQGYSKIEKNETELTVARLVQMSDVLGVRIEDILNFDETTVINISDQGLAAREREIYEKTIRLLEEKIKWLEKGNL